MNAYISPFTLAIAATIEKHVDQMTVTEVRSMVDNLDITITDLWDIMGGRVDTTASQIDMFADHFGMVSPYELIDEAAGREERVLRRDAAIDEELRERDV